LIVFLPGSVALLARIVQIKERSKAQLITRTATQLLYACVTDSEYTTCEARQGTAGQRTTRKTHAKKQALDHSMDGTSDHTVGA
jgi:hypothetical protein